LLLGDNVFGHPPGEVVAVRFGGGVIASARPVPAAELPDLVQGLGDRLLDARGKLVLPGLIDAHIHALSSGMLMLSTDLRGAGTRDELADAVRTAAGESGEFVRLGGLDPSRLGAAIETISREWLDELRPRRAVHQERRGLRVQHAAWERIGVDAG
jgi:predicted amidohydrolase YtcJ